MKLPISVIVLTYNEESNIEDCLKSVSNWASEIIIVDSFSKDKTLEIAKKHTNKIAQRSFVDQAEQFNWALDNLEIKNDWILRLDADEYLTEELKKEIAEILPETSSETAGFYIKRRVHFMGRFIRYGGYYPAWFLRLFKKGKARSEERKMDEHLVLLEGKAEKLKNDFIDDNKKSLSWWIQKHNDYATREAEQIIENPKMSGVLKAPSIQKLKDQVVRKKWLKDNFYYRLPLFCRACLYFGYRYFIRLGFLDGKKGLIFHFLQGFWYRFLVDAKIYERKAKNFRNT